MLILVGKLFIIFQSLSCVLCDNQQQWSDLEASVLQNSSSSWKPLQNPADDMIVFTSVTIGLLNDVDLTRQLIDTTVLAMFEWKNEFVSWDPKEYNHLKELILPQKEVWTPELNFGNEINGDHQWNQLTITVRVSSDGNTKMALVFRGLFECSMDAGFFPFDSHECAVEMSPKFLGDFTMEDNGSNGIQSETTSPLWTKKNEYVEHVPGGVFLEYTIERNSVFFVVNTLVPSVLINYLGVASFIIPCNSGDKTGFGVTIFLAQTVNLMSISQYIPEGGKNLPVFHKYLLASICFIVLITLTNIFLTVIYNSKTPEKFVKSQPWLFILTNIAPSIGPSWWRIGQSKKEGLTFESPELGQNVQFTESANNPQEVDNSGEKIKMGKVNKFSVAENLEAICETANLLCLIACFIVSTIATLSFLLVLTVRL